MSVQHSTQEPQIEAEELAGWCSASETHALAEQLIQLIEQQQLAAGERLPTVRAFAAAMGVSTNVIASVWARLRDEGYIETRRRGGSIICKAPKPPKDENDTLDLSHTSGDAALYPDLEPALLAALRGSGLHSADLDYVIPPLRQCIEQQWPFAAEAWTVVGASSESILLSVAALCPPGGLAAVEQPTSPRLLKILARLNVQPLPIPWDGEGPDPAALRGALQQGATLFIYQPRSQLPLGRSVTASRSAQLAATLADFPQAAVIEDDPLGALIDGPLHSVGSALPDRTVLVRSFCKTFGLDLRTSAIGGGAALITAIRQQRSHGLGMISRILQGALCYLLSHPAAAGQLQAVRDTYRRRRAVFEETLRARGAAFEPRQSGLLLWLPVENEARAIAQLAASQILVAEGSKHYSDRVADAAHISINVAALPDGDEAVRRIANTVADALLRPQEAPFD